MKKDSVKLIIWAGLATIVVCGAGSERVKQYMVYLLFLEPVAEGLEGNISLVLQILKISIVGISCYITISWICDGFKLWENKYLKYLQIVMIIICLYIYIPYIYNKYNIYMGLMECMDDKENIKTNINISKTIINNSNSHWDIVGVTAVTAKAVSKLPVNPRVKAATVIGTGLFWIGIKHLTKDYNKYKNNNSRTNAEGNITNLWGSRPNMEGNMEGDTWWVSKLELLLWDLEMMYLGLLLIISSYILIYITKMIFTEENIDKYWPIKEEKIKKKFKHWFKLKKSYDIYYIWFIRIFLFIGIFITYISIGLIREDIAWYVWEYVRSKWGK